MTSGNSVRASDIRLLPAAIMYVFLGVAIHSLFWQSVLEVKVTATTMMSAGIWHLVIAAFDGTALPGPAGRTYVVAQLDFAPVFLFNACIGGFCWFAGAFWIAKKTRRSWLQALAIWGRSGWLWWLVPGLWELLRLLALPLELPSLANLLFATPHMVESLTLAAWMATFLTLLRPSPTDQMQPAALTDSRRIPAALWIAVGIYAVVFTVMNWQLYRGLLIPHGDSAMYEEHLWNLTHGKGFRSYLDQGLFLGEHIQFVHVLLTPLHWLWPSHLLLELCESLALASGAIPVYWIARRHTNSERAALLLAAGYLLYFPLHFLDISIDLKTFRPISFGVPLMLFALDMLERGRYRGMFVLMLLALSAKEDYAVIVAPLGVWIALRRKDSSNDRRPIKLGWGLAAFGFVYLVLVIAVLIPWFREGADPHYSGYFAELGSTPAEIVENVVASPWLPLSKLFSARSLIYSLALLVPLGFLPLLSPSRLIVGLPLFAVLCLLELSAKASGQGQILIPFHHFHAPLVPILFWAAAAGLGQVHNVWNLVAGKLTGGRPTRSTETVFRWATHFVWTNAFAIALFLSSSPLGLVFWDRNSDFYWRQLYVPGKRAALFPKVFELIPEDARVASTDFIHPRFTHHDRSYDYSHYRRRVSRYEQQVPHDTDFIVIDTRHKYSEIKSPKDIREFREQRDEWELLWHDGYFIVLSRKANRSE